MKAPVPFRRLCIYFFYDPNGIVDEFVLDSLREMALHAERIIVVSNSRLTPASKKLLASVDNVEVTERPNVGFDVWAYKHGIDRVGWEKMVTYDEVIFMNFTIVGPLRPYKEMFDEMQARGDDFWGVNVHSGEAYDPWGLFPEGFIPKHIQSHFIAVRRRMVASNAFQDYWNTMRPIKTYQEAIAFHEAVFTPKFEALGFAWSSYIDTSDLEDITSYPLMFLPKEVIINRRAPFFKRKALLLEIEQYIGPTMAEAAAETVACLKAINYDIGKVLPNIIRTGNQYDIRTSLNANLIVDEVVGQKTTGNVVIVIYVDSQRKYKVLRGYLEEMQVIGIVQIVVGGRNASSLRQVLAEFSNLTVVNGGYGEFIAMIERARREYDIIGIISLSSYVPMREGANEFELYRHGLESLFANRSLMLEMRERLADDAFTGAFAAPQTLHTYDGGERQVWKKHFKTVMRLVREMGMTMPMRADALPLTSESGMFWVKSSALSLVDWKALRAVVQKAGGKKAAVLFNLAFPFFVQGTGRLMYYAMPARIASNLLTVFNFRKIQQEREQALLGEQLLHPVQEEKAGPSMLYYEDKKGRMTEKRKVEIILDQQPDGSVTGSATMPADSLRIRFDPVEARGVICKQLHILVNRSPRKATSINAVETGDSGADLFLNNDPMYAVEGGVKRGDIVTVRMSEITYLSPLPDGIAPTVLGATGANHDASGRLRRFLTRDR